MGKALKALPSRALSRTRAQRRSAPPALRPTREAQIANDASLCRVRGAHFRAPLTALPNAQNKALVVLNRRLCC